MSRTAFWLKSTNHRKIDDESALSSVWRLWWLSNSGAWYANSAQLKLNKASWKTRWSVSVDLKRSSWTDYWYGRIHLDIETKPSIRSIKTALAFKHNSHHVVGVKDCLLQRWKSLILFCDPKVYGRFQSCWIRYKIENRPYQKHHDPQIGSHWRGDGDVVTSGASSIWVKR